MSGYRFVRQYVGGLKALIFDWSGTTADRYVLAPALAFLEVFQKYGVPISMKEARLPMGIRKDLHIKAIIEMESVQQRWKGVHGKLPSQFDVDRMYQDFIPMQLAILPKYSELLPGLSIKFYLLISSFGIFSYTSLIISTGTVNNCKMVECFFSLFVLVYC